MLSFSFGFAFELQNGQTSQLWGLGVKRTRDGIGWEQSLEKGACLGNGLMGTLSVLNLLQPDLESHCLDFLFKILTYVNDL